MPSVGGMPTLSQVRGWGTAHLTDGAAKWTTTATVWEDAFTEVATQITHPGGAPWEGVAAEAAQHRAYTDRLLVVGLADQLHAAARIARTGAMQIDEARRLVLRTVESAESAGFTVGEDFSVTDPRLYDAGTAALRQAQAEAFATGLRAGVGALVATDSGVAGQLTAATAGLGSATFPESDDAGTAVQLVDYKKSPIPDPGTPDDPASAARAPNEVYPGRDARGRFLPGNSASADGAAAAELRLQEFEDETGTTLIRQQIRVAVTDPSTGNPITDPKTGKPLYRYYVRVRPAVPEPCQSADPGHRNAQRRTDQDRLTPVCSTRRLIYLAKESRVAGLNRCQTWQHPHCEVECLYPLECFPTTRCPTSRTCRAISPARRKCRSWETDYRTTTVEPNPRSQVSRTQPPMSRFRRLW